MATSWHSDFTSTAKSAGQVPAPGRAHSATVKVIACPGVKESSGGEDFSAWMGAECRIAGASSDVARSQGPGCRHSQCCVQKGYGERDLNRLVRERNELR